MSHHRVVILRDLESEEERLLPIWIGPFEADAITIRLQGQEVVRPLTHDLLKSVIEALGATLSHIVVSDLDEGTFYARLVCLRDGQEFEVDSRPSDAIALAVRAQAPIYVEESVLERAAITPSPDISTGPKPAEGDRGSDAFRDFVEGLDLGGLEEK
ncbi:MAG TPA: bifunctional nuclease family protein [Anaerolineae bacterium]|nr:bifunctional nuclease family protein [Anaerolineae bacterium]HOR00910.1 bifunctional nuclease family protein [Anaerolineae bacterium]HPL28377.1 bifunctional nuclease family protein [Anaerolineae bacterium]